MVFLPEGLLYTKGLLYKKLANRILAALDSAGLAVVPKEPTRKMIDALNGYAQCIGYVEEGYRAMLAAAKEGE